LRHPGHVYPLTNADAVLNIDCVTNTADVIKEWEKALLIYTEVTGTDGEELKTFIPLSLKIKQEPAICILVQYAFILKLPFRKVLIHP